MLLAGAVVLILLLTAFAVPWLRRAWQGFRPALAVATAQSLAEDLPVLVEVPTLTPTLTPSITPTPSRTPTVTPSPTMTPTPTLTPEPTLTPTPTETAAPTSTATPTPTATRPAATSTPLPTDTSTPTPVPTGAPPTPFEPENGAPFSGESAVIRLAWRSTHTLAVDECFLVNVRWTEGGAPANAGVCVQETQLFMGEDLYLRADQETQRIYRWTVQLVRQQTNAEGNTTYFPLSPLSEESFFYWN